MLSRIEKLRKAGKIARGAASRLENGHEYGGKAIGAMGTDLHPLSGPPGEPPADSIALANSGNVGGRRSTGAPGRLSRQRYRQTLSRTRLHSSAKR